MDKSTMATDLNTATITETTKFIGIPEYDETEAGKIAALIKECEDDVNLLINLQKPIITPETQNGDLITYDNELRAEMQSLNQKLQVKSDIIRTELKRHESNIGQQRIQSDSALVNASLIQSFVNVTRLWKSVQIQVTEGSRRRLKQHLQKCTINTPYDSQEIDHLIELGTISDHVQKLKGANEHAQGFYTEAESHCEQIMELEKSVCYIKLLIAELSAVAKSQGQQTDDLEDDARLAAEICFEGESARWRIATRNKHWMICLFISTFCVIGGITLYYLFFNQDIEVPHVSV